MGIVVNLQEQSLIQMMDEFHRQYAIAQTNQKKAESARLKAAHLLKAMRTRVEAGECGDVTWWQWYDEHSVRSRNDAEVLLKIANDDDPEAALEKRRKTTAEGMSLSRDKEKKFPVERIMKLIRKLTDEQRDELFDELKEEYKR